MTTPPCVFCEIVAGREPATWIVPLVPRAAGDGLALPWEQR